MSSKSFSIFVVLIMTLSFLPAFALTELERVSIMDPKLVNAFGVPLGNNVTFLSKHVDFIATSLSRTRQFF